MDYLLSDYPIDSPKGSYLTVGYSARAYSIGGLFYGRLFYKRLLSRLLFYMRFNSEHCPGYLRYILR